MSRYNGEIPNGASVEANIREMQEYSKTHGYDQTLYYFYLKVKGGGEWDYKRQDKEAMANHTKSKYEDFGNYNYGAVGKAIGLPTSVLLSGAGGAQITSSGGLSFPLSAVYDYFDGLINGDSSRDFGLNDDSVDRKNILDGIDDYNDTYGKDYDLIDGAIDFWKNINDFASSELSDLDFWKDIFDIGLDNLNGWIDFIGDFLDGFINLLLYDPITLDLDNDRAISIIADKDGLVYFDHDCDGVAFRSSWVSPNDGILVFDRNLNGKIDNGSELFGNFTPKFDGSLATDGFNALSDFDTNNDGIISNLDENFGKLQIWQDLNLNGISEANELKSLSEFNIESLNLKTTQTNLNLLVA